MATTARDATKSAAGVLALYDGDLERAYRVLAVAQRIFEETDALPDPDDRVELDNSVARLRGELGERFDGVWADGRALSFEQAQALAASRPLRLADPQ